MAGEGVPRLPIGAAGPAADGEMLLRRRGEISRLLPLAGGRLAAVVAGDELTDDDERRRAAGDDAMVWSERGRRWRCSPKDWTPRCTGWSHGGFMP